MSSRSASTCPGVRVAWDNRRARQHLASLCSRRSSPLSKGVMPVARMFTTLFLSQINSGSNCRAVCLAELLSGPQTKLCLCCMAFRPLRALCRSFCTSGEKPSRGPRGLSQDPDPDCPGDVGAVTAGSLPDALSQHCVSSPVTGRLPAAEGGWPGGVSGHPGAELRARRRTTLALRGGTALLTGSRQVLPRAFGHSPLGDREVLSLSAHHPAWFSGTLHLTASPCSEVTARSAGQNSELQTQATVLSSSHSSAASVPWGQTLGQLCSL